MVQPKFGELTFDPRLYNDPPFKNVYLIKIYIE